MAFCYAFSFLPITEPKGTNRDGVSPAINKGGSQQPLGGLFAGGFPVLRPAGQRDMPGEGFICTEELLGGTAILVHRIRNRFSRLCRILHGYILHQLNVNL